MYGEQYFYLFSLLIHGKFLYRFLHITDIDHILNSLCSSQTSTVEYPEKKIFISWHVLKAFSKKISRRICKLGVDDDESVSGLLKEVTAFLNQANLRKKSHSSSSTFLFPKLSPQQK